MKGLNLACLSGNGSQETSIYKIDLSLVALRLKPVGVMRAIKENRVANTDDGKMMN